MPIDALDQATPEDAAAVVGLRDAAAGWLRSRGIEQWRPGDVGESAMTAKAAAGQLFVVRDAGAVVGAVVVSLSDEAIWGADAGNAGFVHSLVIDRRYAGTGLGLRILRRAEELIAAGGRTRARLDCVASNAELRRYYRDAGYAEVGYRSFEPRSRWSPVMLFEKPLCPVGAGQQDDQCAGRGRS